MLIGGLQKFSLIDYPGKICAIIFTQGCNFKCGYCHNPELVQADQFISPLPEEEVFSFLKTRKNKLDAVSITGGEPTLQPDLVQFIQQLKKIGFLVKLDSNGTRPEILSKLIKENLLDYIAMDIKGPLDKYEEIVGAKLNLKNIQQSIKMIMNSDIDYEFRTTIVKSQLNPAEIKKIVQLIHGAKLYIMQKFVATKANDPKFLKAKTYTDQEFTELKKELLEYVQDCQIR